MTAPGPGGVTQPEKRPLIEVAFRWTKGEPKEKPFTITNGGDDEARNLTIQPVTVGPHRFSFDRVAQLLPGRSASCTPEPGESMGLMFRTLIDGIELAVNRRATELKATLPETGTPVEQFARAFDAETTAHEEFHSIPVSVTFEDRRGFTTILEYRLITSMFAQLDSAKLELVHEVQMADKPNPFPPPRVSADEALRAVESAIEEGRKLFDDDHRFTNEMQDRFFEWINSTIRELDRLFWSDGVSRWFHAGTLWLSNAHPGLLETRDERMKILEEIAEHIRSSSNREEKALVSKETPKTATVVDRKQPQAFLCHGSDDKPLARRIATALQSSGIETFFDEWEIRSGDSLRRKIDAGLAACTHFIALLTPNSIQRPWVNTEMDAAFVMKVKGMATFIPLRSQLRSGELPPLLQGLHAPEITDFETGIKALVADIYGLTLKPPLGPVPLIAKRSIEGETGLSPAAERVAEIFIRKSERGRSYDPQVSVDELREATGLGDTALIDAVDELKESRMLKPQSVIGAAPFGYRMVAAGSPIFEKLDSFIMGWDPARDAIALAARVASDTEHRGHAIQDLMEEFGWSVRRMNPALQYLIDRDLVMASTNVHREFVSSHIFATPKTRRFVRDHS